MFLVVGRLLTSPIIVDGSHALLLNGVESYCRYLSIDAHFENVPLQTSLPEFKSQYPNKLNITKISYDNFEKLIIGSNTCNFLAISSIRVDEIKISPEVGASTKNFNPSTHARIFLSTTSIENARKVINGSSDQLLSMGADPLTYIRQLPSKFNQESTIPLPEYLVNLLKITDYTAIHNLHLEQLKQN